MVDWMVCPDCSGRGCHTLHGHAYTRDELDELGPEFVEDMMAGVYDTSCDTCHGRTTIDKATFADWAELQDMYATMRLESGYGR